MRPDRMPHWPFPIDDPYPVYRRLRDADPVQWCDELGAFIVLSYDDALAVLRSRSWSVDLRNGPDFRAQLGGPGAMAERWSKLVAFSDQQAQTRLRSAISHFLTPEAVEALRPRVSAVADAVLAGLGHRGAVELMSEFAYPVSAAVMAELLNLDKHAAALLRQEAPAMAKLLDPTADRDSIDVGSAAAMRVLECLGPLVSGRSQRPADDLLSSLMSSLGAGAPIDTDEVVLTCLLLVAAGVESMADLIGNGAHALLKHPEELETFTARPDVVPSAMDELVRYDNPVQLASRVCLVDRDLCDHSVRTGQHVLVLLGAANRDPAYFHAPDRLDLSRSGPRPLGFGGELHHCLGEALAGLSASEALARLFRRFDLEVVEDETIWRASAASRGLQAMVVERAHGARRRQRSGSRPSARRLPPAMDLYPRKSSELWDERAPRLSESRGERTVATAGSFAIFALLCLFAAFAVAALVIFPVVEMLKN